MSSSSLHYQAPHPHPHVTTCTTALSDKRKNIAVECRLVGQLVVVAVSASAAVLLLIAATTKAADTASLEATDSREERT
jgi:hypothetical protein